MASLAPNSIFRDMVTGQVDMDTDSFKVMLLTSGYTPNKDTHTKRSDVEASEVVGTAYVAGGTAVTVTVDAVDTVNDDVQINLGGAAWAASTITARYAAYYKTRGGAATADELVYIVDFGSDQVSSNGTFTLNASSIVIANPN